MKKNFIAIELKEDWEIVPSSPRKLVSILKPRIREALEYATHAGNPTARFCEAKIKVREDKIILEIPVRNGVRSLNSSLIYRHFGKKLSVLIGHPIVYYCLSTDYCSQKLHTCRNRIGWDVECEEDRTEQHMVYPYFDED